MLTIEQAVFKITDTIKCDDSLNENVAKIPYHVVIKFKWQLTIQSDRFCVRFMLTFLLFSHDNPFSSTSFVESFTFCSYCGVDHFDEVGIIVQLN